ncbi:hypothetical protein VNO77_15642 [Canavalia gladiata]|uniref:Uncharacterized protein n=1 Tax=Canavalia gladiata TaxID=3824 RepID=A0AAN9LZ85_CANGL
MSSACFLACRVSRICHHFARLSTTELAFPPVQQWQDLDEDGHPMEGPIPSRRSLTSKLECGVIRSRLILGAPSTDARVVVLASSGLFETKIALLSE